MRRRLTAAMVLMVLGALVLSGLASLALAVHNTEIQTRHELVREAQGLATTVQQEADADSRTDPARALRSVLLALKSPLRLDGSAVLAVRARRRALRSRHAEGRCGAARRSDHLGSEARLVAVLAHGVRPTRATWFSRPCRTGLKSRSWASRARWCKWWFSPAGRPAPWPPPGCGSRCRR